MTEAWSDSKKWFLGIASTLAIGVITFVVTNIYYKYFPNLSDEEKASVISLVKDIKSSPIRFRAIYSNKQPFMNGMWSWEKHRQTDEYFESENSAADIFLISHYFGDKGFIGPLIRPRRGSLSGKITEIDELTEVGKSNWRAKLEVPNTVPSVTYQINLNNLKFMSLDRYAIPEKILSHINDISLPRDIRISLSVFNNQYHEAISIKKVSANKLDIFIVSYDVQKGDRAGYDLIDTTALYKFHNVETVAEFFKANIQIAKSLEHWLRKNNMELDLFMLPAPDGGGIP